MPDANNTSCGLGFFLKTAVMNLWVYPVFILVTVTGIIISPLLFGFFAVTKNGSVSQIVRHLVWLYGRSWIWVTSPFVRLERVGFEVFAENPGSIIVVNHLSYFDVYFMGALPDSNAGLTSRSWPRKMIWYTAFVKGGKYIDLEKNHFDQVSAWVSEEHARKNHMVFFPEGHRSRDGKIQRFHSGAFKAAVVNNIPVIPLCLIGTDVLLPPTRSYLKPCTITMKALPAVQPQDFANDMAHSSLKKHVKSLMQKEIYG